MASVGEAMEKLESLYIAGAVKKFGDSSEKFNIKLLKTQEFQS